MKSCCGMQNFVCVGACVCLCAETATLLLLQQLHLWEIEGETLLSFSWLCKQKKPWKYYFTLEYLFSFPSSPNGSLPWLFINWGIKKLKTIPPSLTSDMTKSRDSVSLSCVSYSPIQGEYLPLGFSNVA